MRFRALLLLVGAIWLGGCTGDVVSTHQPIENSDPAGTSLPGAIALIESSESIEVGNFDVRRAMLVDIDIDVTAGEGAPDATTRTPVRLQLDMFDASPIARLERIERNGDGTFSWIGRIEADPLSEVLLTSKNGNYAGSIRTAGALYQLFFHPSSGRHLLQEVDESLAPDEAPPIPVETVPDDVEEDFGGFEAISPTGIHNEIDVLVLYTGAAKAGAGSTAAIEATINLAITETNQGYVNSGVSQRVRLVHTAETSYSETGFNIQTALGRLRNGSDGFMDEAHTLRNTYGADEVVLISEATGGAAGVGYMMTSLGVAFAPNAFAVVSRGYASGYYTFGHELGHNMGSHHDPANASGASLFPFSHGHQSPAAGFRTIMAYACTGCTRVNHWSEPNMMYNSAPKGVAGVSDNAQSLNKTAATVAQFRPSAEMTPSDVATMVSPTPSTTLASSSATFTWNDPGALEYHLSVGSYPSANDYYDASAGTGTSAGVTGLPTNGKDIYVRLWSNTSSDGWHFNDYTYGTQSSASTISTPTPSTTLSSTSVTFGWMDGGAQEYWLQLGSALDGYDLYDSSIGVGTSKTVTGLPSDGSTVYARLWSKFPSGWEKTHATFTAATITPTTATVSSPSPGSTLTSLSETFSWADASALEYWLQVGTTFEGSNIYNKSTGTGLSATVTGLPGDGSTLYVRLWTRGPSGWTKDNVSYTAHTAPSMTAEVNSPTPSSTLTSLSETFSWDDVGALEYWLQVGTSFEGSTIYNKSTGTGLSATVSGLSADGSPLYVRLWTRGPSGWTKDNVSYTAHTAPSVTAMVNSPTPGATLTNLSETFGWADVGALEYWLQVGTSFEGSNIYNKSTGTGLSATVSGLPGDGSTIYVRLWTRDATGWTKDNVSYTAHTAPSVTATVSSPTPSTTLTSTSQSFGWADVGALEYWLQVGTTFEGSNIYNASVGTGLSATVSGLPGNSSTIYVRLWTRGPSGWTTDNVSYTAHESTATLASPTPGSVISGTSAMFSWASTGAAEYWVQVGTTVGSKNIYNGSTGLTTSASSGGLPANGSTIHVRLWTRVGSVWTYTDASYTSS